MTLTTTVEERTKKFVVNAVQDFWDQHQKVCMLSKLGYDLKNSIPDSKKVIGEGLRDYLRQNSLVNVVQFPNVDQKIGAVPLSIDVPDDPTELFKTKYDAEVAPKKPIFEQQFWNGFIRRIDNDKVRVVTPNDIGTVHIEDIVAVGFTTEPGSYIIEEKDLSPVDLAKSDTEKAATTHEKITSWLVLNRLSHEPFLKKTNYANSKDRNDRLSLLLGAFKGLPDSDLARIKIPLDILSKLASSK